ncbi:MAG: kelch repeat-containing protein [Acidobacteriota bacterium]|nr:kelch repeat-containing protein [Acidobacteriota bacterium]
MRATRILISSAFLLPLAVTVWGAPRFVWEPGAKMPIGKGGQVTGFVHGKLLSAGGTYWVDGEKKVWTDHLDVYDPREDSWSAGPAMPFAVSYGGGLAINDRLYVVSGSDGQKDYDYTMVCRKVGRQYHWVWGPSVPEPRIYPASVAIGSKLYVIGGAADSGFKGKVHNDILILDTEHPELGWKTSRPMPGSGRTLCAAAAVGDFIYVFGGYRQMPAGMANSDDALVYDTVNDRWRRLPDAPYAARGWEAIGCGGQVYILGGFVTWPAASMRPEGFTDRILRFDQATGVYADAGELPIPVVGMNIRRMPDGRFIINGGEDIQKHRTDLVGIGKIVG